MTAAVPRIALAGLHVQCSRALPPVGSEAFRRGLDVWGDGLWQELRSPNTRLLADTLGFVTAMDQRGSWEPVPLRMAAAAPGGPVDPAFFEAFCANLEARLKLAGPVDGVYLSLHGAALTLRDDDPQGTLVSRLRARLGDQVPLIAAVDLPANLSDRLCAGLSGLIACRTYPTVDRFACGQAAARLMQRALEEGPGCVVRVAPPLVLAPSALVTAPGSPWSKVLADSPITATEVDDLRHVAVCGGWALADTPWCGVSVAVTARPGAVAVAGAAAQAVARGIWAARAGLVERLTSLEDAVQAARAAARGLGPRVVLADVGDDPGAGGTGSTPALLQALAQAGVTGAVLGLFVDPALARRAHAAGPGQRLEVTFNQGSRDPWAPAWKYPVQVLALSDGTYTGRHGLTQGVPGTLGLSALLQVDSLQVVVVSERHTLREPAQLEAVGVDLAATEVLVAKAPAQALGAFQVWGRGTHAILAVDGPGWTTPNLAHGAWSRLPRPVYPLDSDTPWPEPGAAA